MCVRNGQFDFGEFLKTFHQRPIKLVQSRKSLFDQWRNIRQLYRRGQKIKLQEFR